MTDSPRKPNLSARLLEQEGSLTQTRYEEYRMKLETELDRRERRAKLVERIVKICLVVSLALTFVGGSGMIGSFDPWSDKATILSITLGVICVATTVIFWIGLASYFSRFRPAVRRIREDVLHQSIRELQSEVGELRREVSSSKDGSGG